MASSPTAYAACPAARAGSVAACPSSTHALRACPSLACRSQVYPVDRLNELRPSLVLNLYANGFSFDPVNTAHPYSPAMKTLLSYFDRQVIPLELVDVLDGHLAQFYEGCIVVEVRNHRVAPRPEVKRLLLRPSPEYLAADLLHLLEHLPSMGTAGLRRRRGRVRGAHPVEWLPVRF